MKPNQPEVWATDPVTGRWVLDPLARETCNRDWTLRLLGTLALAATGYALAVMLFGLA